MVCSICLEEFNDPVTTNCRHQFCRTCLYEWFEKGKRDCPMCRGSVSDITEEDFQIFRLVFVPPSPQQIQLEYNRRRIGIFITMLLGFPVAMWLWAESYHIIVYHNETYHP
jgi:hypothetical protein